MDPIETDKEPV